jgi:hypothetical protein
MSYIVTRMIRPAALIRRPFKVIHLVETYDAGVITGQHNGVGSIPCAGMVHFSGTHGMGKED